MAIFFLFQPVDVEVTKSMFNEVSDVYGKRTYTIIISYYNANKVLQRTVKNRENNALDTALFFGLPVVMII